MWDGVIKNQAYGSYNSLYLSIFLSFQGNILSQFSQKISKLESSNFANICRMSDGIMELKFRVMALISLF